MTSPEKTIPTPTETQIRSLQDQFADLSDELTFLCETMGDVLLDEQELSKKARSGMANIAYALEDRIQHFEAQLNALRQTPLEQFDQLVRQCPTMMQYYDANKRMMKIREIWKDFDAMSRPQKFLIGFMISVWNPAAHKYPPIKDHAVLRELEYLSLEDRKIVVEWMNHPFLVCLDLPLQEEEISDKSDKKASDKKTSDKKDTES